MLWLVNTRVWIMEISRQKVFFLNNYCGYFIKELLNGFLCWDNVIQTLGMLLDFREAKNTRLLACLDHVIQTRKTIRYFFSNKEILQEVLLHLDLIIRTNKRFCTKYSHFNFKHCTKLHLSCMPMTIKLMRFGDIFFF